ncbi:MAG: dipeptide epimerase [Herpetosiphonaceae bacterium]|nr:dipeptide epimerase [Herpetosiphonaceae bacterium]
MSDYTLRAVRHQLLDIPLIEPFAIATGTQSIAHNVLVAVELADGTIGWGEAAPFAAVTGETQSSTLAALDRLAALLIGQDTRCWRALATSMRAAEKEAAAARCALETALLDAWCKRAQLPLWAFFGGTATEFETDMTITAGSTEHAARSALAIRTRGITTIKIKIGGDPRIDLDRIAAVHAAAPAAPLILDGNCGYGAAEACALLDELERRSIPVALFEQPTARHDWEGLKQVRHWSTVPVAADETVTTAADALRAAHEDAVTCINIKLMKAGIAEALDIAAICRAAGIQLMIGGMVETILAMTVSAHFAAGLGGFSFVDLDTPMFMAAQPLRGGFRQSGACLSVAHVTAGHGVEPHMPTEG